MAMRPWTVAERRAAALLADDWLAAAVVPAPPPVGVLGAVEHAEGLATPHQLPVAVLGAGSLPEALIVLRLCDFCAWFAGDGTSVVCLRPGKRAARG